MLSRPPRGVLAICALFAAACSGSIDDPASGPATVAPPGVSAPLPPLGDGPLAPDRASAACKTIDPGPSPLRRMTRTEYDSTVRDLLGDTRRPGSGFPGEESTLGFHNNAETRSVSDVLVEGYLSAAERLAGDAVAHLDRLLPCDPARASENACLEMFLETFGKRAWRRPVSGPERENLRAAFTMGRAGGFAEGISAVIQLMLVSPQFLYRTERGVPVAGTSYARLTPYEVAARLSYLLWGSMPDDQLMAAADAGKLGTRAEIEAQARRMVDDQEHTAPMVTEFAGQWLNLDDLATVDKEAMAFP